MKTKKTLIISLIVTACASFFFSCDIPLALGEKLDVLGPVVEFTFPVARKAVPMDFTIEGTVSDNTAVKELVLTVENSPKQWRYSGIWEVSQDNGASWQPLEGAVWDGTNKSAEFSIPINFRINGVDSPDGEYLFILQAWDTGGFTDANSYKTRVFIIDKNPPKVDVYEPYLYRGSEADLGDTSSPLFLLHDIDNAGNEKTDPSYIGKFITQEFMLQWQIDDEHDVWSIDLRFYNYNEDIDGSVWTELPDNYIYRYFKNDLVPPEVPDPQNNIKPNGTVTVPALEGTPQKGSYEGGSWELKNPINTKTTIKVVAACYDAAANSIQEKPLGYFVYWPDADYPWIMYQDGMDTPETYIPDGYATVKQDSFMIYPGRNVKVNAFHAHGLKEIKYSLYDVTVTEEETSPNVIEITNMVVNSTPLGDFKDVVIPNTMRPNGSYSTVFAWEFTPPPHTGYFVVEARAYSEHRESVPYKALFRVQDISFPNFPDEPAPKAGEPLYASIRSDKITISGTVSDATRVEYLIMVWINPESRNYSAMSQLQYFRDQYYKGWDEAKLLSPGATKLEQDINGSASATPPYPYDAKYPNRLWKVPVSNQRLDPNTNRQVYDYSITVNLSDLNIGLGTYSSPPGAIPSETRPLQSLSNQVFLLMAENPDHKAEIITYAPQGDTLSPRLNITNVVITKGGIPSEPYIPNTYRVIETFNDGDIITINGTWEEDSAAYLNPQLYFKPRMNVTVNSQTITLTNITLTQTVPSSEAGEGSKSGTWRASVTVAPGPLSAQSLKDTLVVNAAVADFGGNNAEVGSSWLIQTDYLRLMRISSEMADGTYRRFGADPLDQPNDTLPNYYPDKIRFFLEFNKPVSLAPGRSAPVLTLNTGATAQYVPSTTQNTRQYFEYTIRAGDNTASYLNVDGISGSANWQANNYPLTWQRGAGDTLEQIRVTNVNTHEGQLIIVNQDLSYRVRHLPTDAQNPLDGPFTLFAGKNIIIDTTPPEARTVTAKTAAGYFSTGEKIYIEVEFSKPVKVGATIPQLTLQMANNTTVSTDGTVSVNGRIITFDYTVKAGDTTGANPLAVTGNTGIITDLAGNRLPTSGAGSIALATGRNLTGRFIDTIAPAAPRVRLLSANNISSIVSQTVNGIVRQGDSNAANSVLENVYQDPLYLAVQPQETVGASPAKLEYSINGGGISGSWVQVPNNANTPFAITQPGTYSITARQTDQAGNVSAQSQLITFTWDKGELISRISSTSANGTYTHNEGRKTINVTVTFRKVLTFTSALTPITITLNARNSGGNAITVNDPTSSVQNNTTTLSFTYNVTTGDNTPVNPTQTLDVTAISGFTGVRDAQLVDVSALLNNILPASAEARLGGTNGNKNILVVTGPLTRETIAFKTTSNAGIPALDTYDTTNGWSTNETTAGAKYQGIRSDDGSYWTTLEITYNHPIFKGSGNITIEQIAGTNDNNYYRLPAVLTEAQYNRFRNIDNFNLYYTRGTNGYIYNSATPANSRSDTSTKYVLNYQYNPISVATPAFNGDSIVPPAFSSAFRAEERITISVNSQAVEINGNTLKVRLTGSYAPQVPGATYTIRYPAGLVIDDLGNSSLDSSDANNTNMGDSGADQVVGIERTLGGVAKPFVRIRKTQDIIAARQTGSATVPNFTATQPRFAYVRMDSRTPGSTIQYTRTEHTYTATNNNWSTTAGPNYNTTTVVSGGATITNPGTTNLTRPGTPATTFSDNNNINNNNMQIPAAGETGIRGYKWWVRARAVVGNVNSLETEEMAYRTAITYRLRSGANENQGADMINPQDNQSSEVTSGQQRVGEGGQIWIRGGDAIGSSTIPGFPFTWADDWADWATTGTQTNQKRAGIRLMTLRGTNSTPGTTGTASLNNSTWELMTWDMNATAYVDFILGRDGTNTGGTVTLGSAEYTASNAAQVWQYGPRLWAYHRGGWTGLNTQYPIYPGEHRWLDIGQQIGSGPVINFSSVFSSRPALTAYTGANTN